MASVRRFEWDDLARVAALTARSVNRALRSPTSAVGLRGYLTQPRLQEAGARLVATDANGDLVGFATVRGQADIGSAAVGLWLARDDGALARVLAEAAVARARELGLATVRAMVTASCGGMAGGLAEVGFKVVRSYGLMNFVNVRGAGASGAAAGADGRGRAGESLAVPQGFAARGAGADEREALRRVQNAAFAGHFEYSRNSRADFEHDFSDWETARRGIVLLRDARGGEIAGFVMTSGALNARGEGWLEMLGVLPRWRRYGLGRYLARRGVARLTDELAAQSVWLEVDLGNAAAVGLYERVGFEARPEFNRTWHSLSLGATR